MSWRGCAIVHALGFWASCEWMHHDLWATIPAALNYAGVYYSLVRAQRAGEF
jgi:hypothetical protein